VATDTVIEVTDVRKSFGGVRALQGASLTVNAGEVLALVGDNGAGKSTLAKVICGALRPDSGQLAFWGKPVDVQSIRHAQELGVETVYQDLALAPDLSVLDNVFLGREPLATHGWRRWLRSLDRAAMYDKTDQALTALGITLQSLRSAVRNLSGGQRQAVAVARAVMWARTAILMDEPTAALGTKQTAIVYDSIRAAADRGLAVVVISHDIPRMLTLADRIAVMRHGQIVVTRPAAELSLPQVVGLMLGASQSEAAALS
jgi:simple sugar transport system ATP-binding protein